MSLDTEKMMSDVKEKGKEVMKEGKRRFKTYLKWILYTLIFFTLGSFGLIGAWCIEKGVKRFLKKYKKEEC